ncbi:MAG: rRNA maturation RNase YbeY [Ignavibacteria bacterium]|nr:rRNA maturation RNase YbeY [Ignavibacteria bacterium]
MKKTKDKVKIKANPQILINNLHPSIKLPLSIKFIKESVSKVFIGEKCSFNEIIINFVNNHRIKKLNNAYLNHNFYTDILTFPYSNIKSEIEGEMFISLDTVRNNSKLYNTGYKMELLRVIIHGCLHLAGFLDATKKQKELIREKENFYIGD